MQLHLFEELPSTYSCLVNSHLLHCNGRPVCTQTRSHP